MITGCRKMTLMLLTVYIIQFLLLPKVFPAYYPRSNEATFIFLIPIVLVSVLGIWCFKVNFISCLISDLIYCVCICIYNGKGFYGIGLRGIALDGSFPSYSFKDAVIHTVIFFLVFAVFQAIVSGLFVIFLKLKSE